VPTRMICLSTGRGGHARLRATRYDGLSPPYGRSLVVQPAFRKLANRTASVKRGASVWPQARAYPAGTIAYFLFFMEPPAAKTSIRRFARRIFLTARRGRAGSMPGPRRTEVVIARESGRSSNHMSLNRNTTCVYWMPRFRGA
jgi:hypothetical protein